MADNSTLPVNVGTEVFANDDVGPGVKYPRVKLTWGPDGTASDADVATGKPIPIQLRGSDGTDRSNLLPVSISGTPAVTQSGTWTVQPGNTANTTAWLVNPGLQLGAGAATGTTTRVTIDTGQLGALVNNSVPTITGGFEYETVAVSQTDQVMGATGAVGDYLESVLCVVATAATSQVQIKDGNGSAITILPNAVGAGVGSYPIPIGLRCVNSTTPGWKISTAAGVTVIATGDFT